MAFWREAKERTNINRSSEPFLIVQCRDVRQGDDRTYSGHGHQSARQITFARYGPYFVVQRISGNAECLVQRDECFWLFRDLCGWAGFWSFDESPRCCAVG